MESIYFKEYSHCLDRDMEFQRYGGAGMPCVYIPCQNGRFWDFSSFHMDDTLSPYIESGRLQVFSIDTVDMESYSAVYAPARPRIERQEQYFHYVTDELVPRIREITGWQGSMMTFGCSMGAMHAGNFYFRRPDIFSHCLALSGTYDTESGFGGYHDDLTYANSPSQFLANLAPDHWYMDLYRKGKCVICVGQGAWEDELLAGTKRLQDVVRRKNIPVWIDIWGWDVAHDWYWWYRQAEYFMPILLG